MVETFVQLPQDILGQCVVTATAAQVLDEVGRDAAGFQQVFDDVVGRLQLRRQVAHDAVSGAGLRLVPPRDNLVIRCERIEGAHISVPVEYGGAAHTGFVEAADRHIAVADELVHLLAGGAAVAAHCFTQMRLEFLALGMGFIHPAVRLHVCDYRAVHRAIGHGASFGAGRSAL